MKSTKSIVHLITICFDENTNFWCDVEWAIHSHVQVQVQSFVSYWGGRVKEVCGREIADIEREEIQDFVLGYESECYHKEMVLSPWMGADVWEKGYGMGWVRM